MINFENLKYKNFLSTGDQSTVINFTKYSTNLIVGKNGAGKCFNINTIIKVKNKKTGEIKEMTVGEFYDIQKKQNN